MDDKLTELEYIFNKIMNIPKKNKTIDYDCLKDYKNKEVKKTLDEKSTEIDLELVNENKKLSSLVYELNKRIFEMETKIVNYENQIKTLNEINFDLKSNEKILRDEILKAKGSIRVLCRIKPAISPCKIKYDDTLLSIDDKKFLLNHIFDPKSSQEEIFDELKHEIESIMDGYNICIFAYGQTGSGKTFTMEGYGNNPGLIYRSLNLISSMSEKLKEDGFTVNYEIKYVEIYLENITDLINGNPVTITHEQNRIKLKNTSDILVENISNCYEMVKNAAAKRARGSTECNSVSSRSHSVFIIKVNIEGNGEKREGSLCLIDLAGSERLDKSKAENERLKETQFINKSLSALGNVISALKRKDKHIPFRDSKLTHVMQEFLTEKSRTSMIVNIDPENLDETVCSLRFATKVSECDLGVSNRNISKVI